MRELSITGYLDRLSGRPGEPIEARVSVRDDLPYRSQLVRVLSADPNPAGPGVRFEDLSRLHDANHAGRRQPIRLGSYMEARAPANDGATTWTALVFPTVDQADARVVLYQCGNDSSLTLTMGQDVVEARLGDLSVRLEGQFGARRWYRLWVSACPETGRLAVGIAAPAHLYEPALGRTAEVNGRVKLATGGLFRVAAAVPGDIAHGFTGKIEDPAILAGFHETWPHPLASMESFDDALRAGWDFGRDIARQAIPGIGPEGHEGRLVNLPMRGVVGARWQGREHDWRYAPDQYAAIRFHEDDLGDCGWLTDFIFTIPAGLASGAYALHLSCADGEDWLPFYVLPEPHGVRPKIAFLAATYTYVAYGNNARGNTDDAFMARVAQWGAYPANADHYPIYGRSTYNHHPDGSGIAFSSRYRPLLTMRPGYMTMFDPKGSGLRHYPADSHILAWLEAMGFEFDIVTDEDLDAEGAALLDPYAVVMTGSHPEYHTEGTLDALQAHVAGGGRLAYLGGNGFYWRIGTNPEVPWALELRRAENGIRRWASEAGEYRHQLDGELGGLWSRARRDPRQLVGTAFAAQGAYEASHFRRTPASYEPKLAWMFQGIKEEILGDYGLIAGGAAGFELDRVDTRLGTPADATVVAITENLPPSFFPAHEDLSGGALALDGSDASKLVRGDMTYFETHNGGAVFSASSITFCGSLWKDGAFQGPISQLLFNVIQHFSR